MTTARKRRNPSLCHDRSGARYRDRALGFWGALSEVFPDRLHQRSWVHKMGNVMNPRENSAQRAAPAAAL